MAPAIITKEAEDLVSFQEVYLFGDTGHLSRSEEALKTASEYTFDRQERELIDFWKKVFE